MWNDPLQTINGTHIISDAIALCGGINIYADEPVIAPVINIESMYSLFGSLSSIAYAAGKGGVVQLTKSLATAWAAHGINVNTILLGWIETDMTAPFNDQPAMVQQFVSRTPFGIMGRIDEMAGAAVFLASTGSNFVTGVSVPVDGGYSVA